MRCSRKSEQRASENDAVGARTLADMQRSRLMDMESKALSREDVIKSLSQQRDTLPHGIPSAAAPAVLSQELAEYKQRCLSLNARVLEAASAANEENARFDAKELKAYQKQVSDQAVELDKARRNEAKAAGLQNLFSHGGAKTDFESRVVALKQQSKADRDKLAQERQTATKLKGCCSTQALLKEKIGQIGVSWRL